MPRRDDWDDRPRRRRKKDAPLWPWLAGGAALVLVTAAVALMLARRGGRADAGPDAAGGLLGLAGLDEVAGPADPNAFPPAEEKVWKRLVGGEWEARPGPGLRRVLRFTPDRYVVRGQSSHGANASHGRTDRDRVVGVTLADRGRFVVRLGLGTVGRAEVPGEVGRLWFEGDELVHLDNLTNEEYRYTRKPIAAARPPVPPPSRPHTGLTPLMREQVWVTPQMLLGAGGIEQAPDAAWGLLQGRWRRRALPADQVRGLNAHPTQLTVTPSALLSAMNYAELTAGATPDQPHAAEVIDVASRAGWVRLFTLSSTSPDPAELFLRFRTDDEFDLVVKWTDPTGRPSPVA